MASYLFLLFCISSPALFRHQFYYLLYFGYNKKIFGYAQLMPPTVFIVPSNSALPLRCLPTPLTLKSSLQCTHSLLCSIKSYKQFCLFPFDPTFKKNSRTLHKASLDSKTRLFHFESKFYVQFLLTVHTKITTTNIFVHCKLKSSLPTKSNTLSFEWHVSLLLHSVSFFIDEGRTKQ